MTFRDISTGLQHIGMPTNDIERTIRFYEALGFEVAFRTNNKGEEVAFLRLGDLTVETYQNFRAAQVNGAWDHLVMAGRYYPNVDQARMEKVLEIVGLSPYKKERCGKFSLGMKQRMGLALALLSEPELMILDEPTNGLDIEATVEIREIIIRLAREKGVTFLVASHLASEIEKMCSKVMVLYEGEMLSCDSKEEALRLNPSMEDYFLAKVRDKKGSVVL